MKTIAVMLAIFSVQLLASEQKEKPSFEQFLRQTAASSEAIDRSVRERSRWKFDSELGFVERNYSVPGAGTPLVPGGMTLSGGVDGSTTIATIQPNGARTSFVYAGRRARINTYGDSFTHCDQVNDAETWQEYLAAHLGEPVVNFGTGGHGVYQAYRRMVREEKTDHGAEYLILYIWGDDSTRTLYRSWTPLTLAKGMGVFPGAKANVEMDLDTGALRKKRAYFPRPSRCIASLTRDGLSITSKMTWRYS